MLAVICGGRALHRASTDEPDRIYQRTHRSAAETLAKNAGLIDVERFPASGTCKPRKSRAFSSACQGLENIGLLAGGLGFEPRQAESESAVLPLDDPPKPGSRRAFRALAFPVGRLGPPLLPRLARRGRPYNSYLAAAQERQGRGRPKAHFAGGAGSGDCPAAVGDSGASGGSSSGRYSKCMVS
jgi:hypothetical protein